jgi:tyrosinase
VSTGVPHAREPAAPIRFRRDASRLTPDQSTALRDGFSALYDLPDDRGYGYLAGIHGLPLPIGCDNAHGTPYFLPWHRAYLYSFERALRDRVPGAMLAWWDWRTSPERPAKIPKAFDQKKIGSKDNPLASAAVSRLALAQGKEAGASVGRRTARSPGDPSLLPSATDVKAALETRDFLDFSAAAEELHNRVHVWVGGHMGQIPFAAFDPIFWAHHTMVDRLWRLWQLQHPGGRPPAALLDEALPPFRMTVRQTLDPTALGYEYAVASTSAAVKAKRR